MGKKIHYKFSSEHDDFADLTPGDHGIIECDDNRLGSLPKEKSFLKSIIKKLVNLNSDFSQTADSIFIYNNCFIEIRNFDPLSNSLEQDYDVLEFEVSDIIPNLIHNLFSFPYQKDTYIFVTRGEITTDNLVCGVRLTNFSEDLSNSKINLKIGRSGYTELIAASITDNEKSVIADKIKHYIENGIS